MILVTGAKGSVGQALVARLREGGFVTYAFDVDEMDVTDAAETTELVRTIRPSYVFHLAGAKHAFEGELDPMLACEVNVIGTRNVLGAAGAVGAKVIFSSTCKACDPETAYGASKLIAERLVLNAGGVVCRFYNIPESQGNVFRFWEKLDKDEPIPYTDCWRYFIPMSTAVDLLIVAMDFPNGRYVADPGLARHMRAVAISEYPGRPVELVPRRRGDRAQEPLKAACEEIWPLRDKRFCAVVSPYEQRVTDWFDSVLAVA